MTTRKTKPRKAAAKKKPVLKNLLVELISFKRAKEKVNAQLAVLQKASSELEDKILQHFTDEEISSVRVPGGLATKIVEVVPQVDDWDAFYAFVRKQDAFELLQKRITSTAWRERVDAGQEVPGVGTFNRVYLKLTLSK